MRYLLRVQLSDAAEEKLCELTHDVANAGIAAGATIRERVSARKAVARAHWDHRTKNAAFREIRKALHDMAPGAGLCMYCEVSIGHVIEHFWPKEKYPGRAFSWKNYLWACSICNTDHKGTKFPRGAQGEPLLLDPTAEDPAPHLEFSPTTGKLTGVTEKGRATVETLGFEKRGDLDRFRRNVWHGLEEAIVLYSVHHLNGNIEKAASIERRLREQPFGSALSRFLAFASDPARRASIHPACLAAIEKHPEIHTWV